jgi:HlyD family secretion protein
VSVRDARAAAATLGIEAPHLRDAAAQARAASGTDTQAAPASGSRPAVVFVEAPEGPQARVVTVGLNDWDYTEVVSGLEPGDRVVLISLAQMQKQQQEATERMRQRMAGPMGATTTPAPKRGGN